MIYYCCKHEHITHRWALQVHVSELQDTEQPCISLLWFPTHRLGGEEEQILQSALTLYKKGRRQEET